MKVLICLALVCAANVYGKVTPDYFPQCKRNDPQIEKCVLEAVETLRPRLNEGIPEVNVPGLEPFNLPTLKLDRTAPNLRLKATIRNMKAFGGSQFRIDKLKINLNNKYAAELKIFIPRLRVEGDYDVKGSRLLVLNIDGKGSMKSNFNGVEYLQAEKIITKIKISHGQVEFDDTERPVAATSAASFFNASPNVVLDILNPLIEETSAAILKAFLNKVFLKIPLNEILVDDAPAAAA